MKTKRVNMDLFYFKKYSKYINNKERITLFLTLKNQRSGCLIDVNSRYEKSLIRILRYYKMNYVTRKDEKDVTSFYISKKVISDEVKRTILISDYSSDYYITLGKFLGYPYPMDFSKDRKDGDAFVHFYFILDKKDHIKKDKKKECFHTYRIPESKINGKLLKDSKITIKKFKKCIKKNLSELYPNFDVKLEIKM